MIKGVALRKLMPAMHAYRLINGRGCSFASRKEVGVAHIEAIARTRRQIN